MYRHREFALRGERKEAMEKILCDFIQRGWFEPCRSEWASPCFFVPKKVAGEWRLVVDYPAPAPRRLAAGAQPGLLYVGGPLAAGSPATHRQRPQQEAGTGMGKPPWTGLEPRPGGAYTGRVAGRRHQGHGRPGPPRGANHERPPAVTLAVAQRGQQNPQWPVCMFSPADAHTPSACRGPKPWSAWQTAPA